ncbi:MAG: radical SAM protein [Candidatus Omnitrophota bacterium]
MIRETHPLRFANSIHTSAQKKHIPLRVLFELTYDCNFDCIHCYVSQCNRKIETLATKEIFRILNHLQELGSFHLGFSGGEIFLRKDILDILWYAKHKGFNIILLTNGSLIDRYIAEELRKLTLNKVDITLHSLNRSHFEAISRTKGSYVKVMRAIELLHQYKVPLGIKNCSLALNRDDLQEVREFAEKLGAVARIGAGVISSTQENMMQQDICVSGGRQTPDSRHLFPCGAGTHSMVINPQGQLKLCPHIDYPLIPVVEGGVAESWHTLHTIIKNIEDEYRGFHRAQGRGFPLRWCPAKSWVTYGNFTQAPADTRNPLENGAIKNIAEALA